MNAPDLRVPVQLSDSFSCVDARSDERDESGGDSSPKLGFRRGRRRGNGQRSHVGDAPVISGDAGVHDAMRLGEASSKASSRSSFSSWSGREAGLVVLTAPACFGRCRVLQDKAKGKYVYVRQIKGSPGVSRRDGVVTLLRRNRRFTAAGLCFSGEQFRQPGGAIRRERRGSMERESRATYSRGLGAELLRQ
jgi:hypothetical protein